MAYAVLLTGSKGTECGTKEIFNTLDKITILCINRAMTTLLLIVIAIGIFLMSSVGMAILSDGSFILVAILALSLFAALLYWLCANGGALIAIFLVVMAGGLYTRLKNGQKL